MYFMAMIREALGTCPICGGEMIVAEYSCVECGSSVKGAFKRCDLCNLPMDSVHFIRVFLKCEGSIKEVEKILGLSYPTVKARLAKINQRLGLNDFDQYLGAQDRLNLLKDFQEGKISLDDVIKRIQET